MALVLTIANLKEFYETINFALKPYYTQLDFQCTRTHFALAVSRPTPLGRCFIELQLQAQFFPNYAITSGRDITLIHRAISPQQFFNTFHAMIQSGFDYAILGLVPHHPSLKISFYNYSDPHRLDLPYHHTDPFLPTCQRLDPNRANSTTYVAFPQFPLESMLATFNNNDSDHFIFIVTLTTSEAKFTTKDHIGRDVGFILNSEQKKECVIQGVTEGEEIQIVILLNPIESFRNIISLSNPEKYWVVVGKPNNNSNRGIIVINRGLYTRYFFYSTE